MGTQQQAASNHQAQQVEKWVNAKVSEEGAEWYPTVFTTVTHQLVTKDILNYCIMLMNNWPADGQFGVTAHGNSENCVASIIIRILISN